MRASAAPQPAHRCDLEQITAEQTVAVVAMPTKPFKMSLFTPLTLEVLSSMRSSLMTWIRSPLKSALAIESIPDR